MIKRCRTPLGRAAFGAIIGGPVGAVTALATGWSLVIATAGAVSVGALIGALTAETDDLSEAVIDAILPVGAWLVGAAIAWVLLSTQNYRLPEVVQTNPRPSTLAAAVLGGTVAVIVLVMRVGKHAK